MILRAKKFKKLILLFILALGLILGGGWGQVAQSQNPPNPNLPRPIVTQTVRIQTVSRLIYAQMADFPAENQYLNRRTGVVDTEDTLVSRLIRYHVVAKNRAPMLRFDWRLTLADYLGVNEPMIEDRYPGTDTLQPEPMRGDRTAVSRLTPTQRMSLINLLVAAFTPVAIEPAQLIFPTPAPSVSPISIPTPTPSGLQLPQPGDAQFLRF
jgi:hypothetical protein